MLKTILNAKAVKLRKQGLSYSEILKQVPVAKSTLSLWLRSVGLSKQQHQRLTEKKLRAMQLGWKKVHDQRMERWSTIKNASEKEINKLTKNERWLLGVALYWAEGAKEAEYRSSTPIKFSNTDPTMLLVFRSWLKEFSGLPMENIRYELYIHEKANWKTARKFWASKLKIQPDAIRVYFKPHNSTTKRKNTGTRYHGLIRICMSDSIPLVRKISGWTEGIYKNWGIV